tara:strand:- start:376 stop:633 length:258 start_codon:yes stop_codon:yes gene_type:complete
MNEIINQNALEHQSESRLFAHYSKFFNKFVIEEFRKKYNADTSFEGHRGMMLEIEAYVQQKIKHDKKADYYNLVDTLKKLAENDI